jgi:hypothetical protein
MIVPWPTLLRDTQAAAPHHVGPILAGAGGKVTVKKERAGHAVALFLC